MPTKFAKGDEVRVDAKKFDGEGELDELGLKEFPPLLVFPAAFMRLLCVKNSIVGNAI
jgi:hypothetical protein